MLIVIYIISGLILLALIIFFSSEFYNVVFRGFAPFVSSQPKVIKKILSELQLNENNVVYELGSGKAGFLRAVEERFPKTKLIGAENAFFPFVIASIQKSLNKSKIKILKKNLFKVNISEADLIYCFLNVKMMKKLEDKFRRECRPGTRIISYAFFLPNIKPEKVIDMENKSKIYFYKL